MFTSDINNSKKAEKAVEDENRSGRPLTSTYHDEQHVNERFGDQKSPIDN